MKREDFSWTKFSHENVTMISRIEAIRKIIDQEVGLEPCLPGIAEIEPVSYTHLTLPTILRV